jgi:hypothetical protein
LAFLKHHTSAKLQGKKELLIIEQRAFGFTLQIHQRSSYPTHSGHTSCCELSVPQLTIEKGPTGRGKPTETVDLGGVQSTVGTTLTLLGHLARRGYLCSDLD